MFGLGCFWGAERKFWQLPGVYSTAVGYAAGYTPNPTYREVCSGMTGHNEVVLVVFDPKKVSYETLLKTFWESHDPTQGMRQGNDVGTQYRSGIYYFDDAQREAAERSRDAYQAQLSAAGYGRITTEILPARRVLLRRGLPPAVPRQESRRLLRSRRHGRQLSGRGGSALTSRATCTCTCTCRTCHVPRLVPTCRPHVARARRTCTSTHVARRTSARCT